MNCIFTIYDDDVCLFTRFSLFSKCGSLIVRLFMAAPTIYSSLISMICSDCISNSSVIIQSHCIVSWLSGAAIITPLLRRLLVYTAFSPVVYWWFSTTHLRFLKAFFSCKRHCQLANWPSLDSVILRKNYYSNKTTGQYIYVKNAHWAALQNFNFNLIIYLAKLSSWNYSS